MALRYLVGSVTQGGADAFAINTLVTALEGATRVAYRVRELLFEVPRVSAPGTAVNMEVALIRRTKAAMPLITDTDVIAKVKLGVELQTSGAIAIDLVRRLVFAEDDELLIVEDPIYLAVDSAATALTQTVYCRIGYEQRNISELDRLTLLTQSL